VHLAVIAPRAIFGPNQRARLRQSRADFLAFSSIAGLGGDWNQAGYNATKGR
jgi:hypothetical protein